MADLVVFGFDNLATAEEVFEIGFVLEEEKLLDLEDAAVAWRDDKGKVRIQQRGRPLRARPAVDPR